MKSDTLMKRPFIFFSLFNNSRLQLAKSKIPFLYVLLITMKLETELTLLNKDELTLCLWLEGTSKFANCNDHMLDRERSKNWRSINVTSTGVVPWVIVYLTNSHVYDLNTQCLRVQWSCDDCISIVLEQLFTPNYNRDNVTWQYV